MLLLLSRHVLPIIAGNGLSELLAEAVELQPGIGELAIDKPHLRDHHSDVRSRGLRCALSYSQGRFAQLTDHTGRVETAYAMAPKNASNGCFAHARGLFRRWCGFSKIQEPFRANVVGELKHLGIVAPELIPQPVSEPDPLYLEFFVDARPFLELDHDRLGDG